MSVPKFRNAKSRVRRRRSHHALKAVQTATCSNCGEAVLPHRACNACGFYKGRSVTADAAKVEKTLEKATKKTAKKEKKKTASTKKAEKEEAPKEKKSAK